MMMLNNKLTLITVILLVLVSNTFAQDFKGGALIWGNFSAGFDKDLEYDPTLPWIEPFCINGSAAPAETLWANKNLTSSGFTCNNSSLRCPYGTCCNSEGYCGPIVFNSSVAIQSAFEALNYTTANFCDATTADWRFINCSFPEAVQVIPRPYAQTSPPYTTSQLPYNNPNTYYQNQKTTKYYQQQKTTQYYETPAPSYDQATPAPYYEKTTTPSFYRKFNTTKKPNIPYSYPY
jgi:hypothetical protein